MFEQYTSNLNVFYTLLFTIIDGASSSIRGGDIVSILIYMHSNSKAVVGNLTGISGIIQMLFALPGGWAADRWRRDRVIALSTLLGLLSSLLMSLWLLAQNDRSINLLFASMVLFGGYRGLQSGSLEAIYADATTEQNRARLFTLKYIFQNLSWALGPGISCLFFLYSDGVHRGRPSPPPPPQPPLLQRAWGDMNRSDVQWNVRACKDIVQFGVLLGLPGYLVSLLLSDTRNATHAALAESLISQGPNSVSQTQIPVLDDDTAPSTTPAASGDVSREGTVGAVGGGSPGHVGSTGAVEVGRPTDVGEREARERTGVTPSTSHAHTADHMYDEPVDIRLMIRRGLLPFLPLPSSPRHPSTADEEAATRPLLRHADHGHDDHDDGSGSPTCAPLKSLWVVRSTFVPWCIFLSDLIGALASGMTLKFFSLFFVEMCELGPAAISAIGTLSPLFIALFSSWARQLEKAGWGRLQINLQSRVGDIALLLLMAKLPTGVGPVRIALVAIHLLRMALANCSRPLLRSILMDNVPRSARARWNAADSIRQLGWSGSAALGGLLVEAWGYERTFIVTSGIKAIAMLPLLVLRPMFK